MPTSGQVLRDDRLDQAPLRPRRLQVEHVLGRRHQAANPLQLDDRLDDAHEQQPVAGPQHFARRNGGNRVAVAVDLGEEQPGRCRRPALSIVLPTSGLSASTCISTVYSLGSSLRAQGGAAVGQQVAGGEDDIDSADERRRHADPGDVEHAELVLHSPSVLMTMPWTTRFVLVPISVIVPPRIAA